MSETYVDGADEMSGETGRRGRPRKIGRRVSVLIPEDFARFARSRGAALGLSCGEWIAWRIRDEYEAWKGTGADRQPGDRPG